MVQTSSFAASLVFLVLEISLLGLFQKELVLAFTSESKIAQHFENVSVFWLISGFLDMNQGVLSGTIRALAQQSKATVVYMITFYVLAIPLSYILAFNAFHSSALKVLEGLAGIWTALIIGLLN